MNVNQENVKLCLWGKNKKYGLKCVTEKKTTTKFRMLKVKMASVG